MIPKVKEIHNYLQGHPRREILVLDKDTNVPLSERVSLNAITQTGAANLQVFLQQLNASYPTTKNMLVQVYQPNGVGRSKLKETLNINWEPGNNTFLGESSSAKGVGGDSPAPTELIPQNNKSMNTDNPQFPVQNFGMGAAFHQQISLYTKAERYDELKEKNAELLKKVDKIEDEAKQKLKKLEDEYVEKLKKLNLKNDDLHVELREAKSDLKLANDRKDFELLKKDLDKKPLIDPEVVRMAIEQGGPILAAVMSKGQMPQQVTSGLTGAENLSEVKKALVEEIYKETFSDEMATNLTNLYMVLLENNPLYNTQLTAVINQYNSN